MDLEFIINEQKMTRGDSESPVDYSENYLNLLFTFETEEWSDLTKFVIFNKETRVPVVDGSVTVPSSVLESDRFYFTVYGIDNENDTTIRITTNYILVYLGESRYTSDTSDLPDVTDPDTIEQIYIAINRKADTSTVYTKTETDNLLNDKADSNEVYTKTETDNLLTSKSDITHTHDERYYTQTEIDNLIENLQNRVTLTGDESIIQTNETCTLTTRLMEDGFTIANKTIKLYKED